MAETPLDTRRLLKWPASTTAHRVVDPLRRVGGWYRAACGEPCRTFVSIVDLNPDVVGPCGRCYRKAI